MFQAFVTVSQKSFSMWGNKSDLRDPTYAALTTLRPRLRQRLADPWVLIEMDLVASQLTSTDLEQELNSSSQLQCLLIVIKKCWSIPTIIFNELRRFAVTYKCACEGVCFLFTICWAEAPGSWHNGDGGAAVDGADVVHVGINVGVWRVEGGLRPHRGVPLRWDPNEGDVGKGRTARQRRRPAEEHT